MNKRKVEPIHSMEWDELNHALDITWDQIEVSYTHRNAKPQATQEAIEWQINFNLKTLADSISQSLIYFYPEKKELIQEASDDETGDFTWRDLNSMAKHDYPLYEGTSAILKIFFVLDNYGYYLRNDRFDSKDKIDSISSDFEAMKTALKEYAAIASTYYLKPGHETIEKQKNRLKKERDSRSESIKIRNGRWQKEISSLRKKYPKDGISMTVRRLMKNEYALPDLDFNERKQKLYRAMYEIVKTFFSRNSM